VGVVAAEDIADDAGALAVGRVVAHAHLAHGVEDAALDWLQAVTHIGQSPGGDDGHSVVQIRPAHLLVNVHLFDDADFHATPKARE
jgi:hypothetical protein